APLTHHGHEHIPRRPMLLHPQLPPPLHPPAPHVIRKRPRLHRHHRPPSHRRHPRAHYRHKHHSARAHNHTHAQPPQPPHRARSQSLCSRTCRSPPIPIATVPRSKAH